MVRAAMADEIQPDDDLEPGIPMPCAPCHGQGKLISGAGGTPHEVQCPWCEGTGVTIPGHDAQEARRQDQGGAASA